MALVHNETPRIFTLTGFHVYFSNAFHSAKYPKLMPFQPRQHEYNDLQTSIPFRLFFCHTCFCLKSSTYQNQLRQDHSNTSFKLEKEKSAFIKHHRLNKFNTVKSDNTTKQLQFFSSSSTRLVIFAQKVQKRTVIKPKQSPALVFFLQANVSML